MAFQLRFSLAQTDRTVAPGGVAMLLRGYQPAVWVKLVQWERPQEELGIAFPAVLDTGNNHSFLIPGSLFQAWMQIEPEQLDHFRTVLVNGVLLRCYGFNVDLLRLRSGQPTARVAGRLQTDRGIAIIPRELEHRFPRMPVIGVRCLVASRVTFSLNGDKQTFSLSQSRLTPVRRGSA
jgi:hypothetical protein